MKRVERIKNICVTPHTEWPVIRDEIATHGSLLIEYVLPLASLSALAVVIGNSVIGQNLLFLGSYRVPISTSLTIALISIVTAVVGTVLLGIIVNALAPTFGGSKDAIQAFKLVVYAYTPAWVAGLFYILPFSTLLTIIAVLYGLYLLYLGLPVLMKSNADKSVAYTVSVIFAAVVLSLSMNLIFALISNIPVISNELQNPSSRNTSIEFDHDSPMGKLQDFSQKMDHLSEKMSVAEQQGDHNQQIAVAVEALGGLLSGGKKVDAMTIEQLKDVLPEHFAGMPKTSKSAEKSGALGITVSKASAVYADNTGKKVTLEISDMGGISGLLALASWVNIQGEQEDQWGYEKTYQAEGRMLHEKSTKKGDNEFSIVIAKRFMVSAKAQGVDIATLKNGVMKLNLPIFDAE